MKSEQIRTEFNDTFTKLLEILSNFDIENFNTKPAADKWSAGQVARHLIKANSGFKKMVNGQTRETERAPDTAVEKIKTDFLNFEKPMSSPDFIVPEDEKFEKKEMVNALEKIKVEINETAENADLTRTLMDFEFPVYGHLTGLEMLSFAVYHTQRHIHQINKIGEKILN